MRFEIRSAMPRSLSTPVAVTPYDNVYFILPATLQSAPRDTEVQLDGKIGRGREYYQKTLCNRYHGGPPYDLSWVENTRWRVNLLVHISMIRRPKSLYGRHLQFTALQTRGLLGHSNGTLVHGGCGASTRLG